MFCIGHRGARGHAPENTLASVCKALELGAHAIEVDVYAVQGHLVVFHDERLERTTNGTGLLVEQSFEYLRSLDAGYGQKIPTLEEVLEILVHHACINIELKGSGAAELVPKALADAGAGAWEEEAVLVSSFNRRELECIRTLNPTIRIGILSNTMPSNWSEASRRLQAYSLHLPVPLVDRPLVEHLHRHGLRIFPFTANTSKEIRAMIEVGADGVFSDYPERVREACPVTKSNIGWP